MTAPLFVLLATLCACSDAGQIDFTGPIAQWPEYGGNKGGLRYSPLTQISRENVGGLEVAWDYRHGDRSDGSGEYSRTAFQATPIVADGTMYFCTGFNRVIALDPETGDILHQQSWCWDAEPGRLSALAASLGREPLVRTIPDDPNDPYD